MVCSFQSTDKLAEGVIMTHIIACLFVVVLWTAQSSGADLAPTASGQWKTVARDGIHWIQTPDGRLFYSKGVNIVTGGAESEKSKRKQAFYWANFHRTIEEWRRTVGAQLLGWGFNTRGGWSDPSPDIDLALTVDLELGRNSKFHWFDPFDPAMEQQTLEHARKLTAPYRNDPRLLGYFSDNEVGWWNSPLFSWYLQKGWDNHTKRVLWQLLYNHYGGQWDRLLTDWVVESSLSSFEDLKIADAKLQLRAGGKGIQLVDRFMYLCASRYYSLMAKALRQAHPGALVLGDRLPLYYHQDAVRAMGDNVDIISTNYNVDVPDGWVAPYYFEGLRRLTDKPVMITEFFFAAEENRSGNRNETARSAHPKPGHLMTVETQAQRAWGTANALRNFARFPNVVGTHWFQYCDEPMGGREDGEDYNMGLIDTSNCPYEAVTEAFRAFNPAMEHFHRESGAFASNGYVTPPRVVMAESEKTREEVQTILFRAERPLDVEDQSLMDWEKEKTRLQGFQAADPYVPFGDVHMTWTPEGLYLASLANTYVDPRFLAYEGDFPLSEAFQLELTVEAEGKSRQFAVYLIPRANPLFPDGFEVQPRLYRMLDGKPSELLPVRGRIQRLDKSLPHMALEAFLPAEWVGLKNLQPGMKLRLSISMTSYYRELTMRWAGTVSLDAERDSKIVRSEG
jgi:hypothetical protein